MILAAKTAERHLQPMHKNCAAHAQELCTHVQNLCRICHFSVPDVYAKPFGYSYLRWMAPFLRTFLIRDIPTRWSCLGSSVCESVVLSQEREEAVEQRAAKSSPRSRRACRTGLCRPMTFPMVPFRFSRHRTSLYPRARSPAPAEWIVQIWT